MTTSFLQGTAVKDIFDNIRNIGISASVSTAGYLLAKNRNALSPLPEIPRYFGWTLLLLGFCLFMLNTIHGLTQLERRNGNPIIIGLYLLFSLFVGVMLFMTFWLNGIRALP